MALLLVGTLLSATVTAQAPTDLARLIFEVAPIPADAVSTGAAAGADGAAPLAPGPANPDTTASSADFAADIRAYEARISETLATDNPYSNALREQYDALGTLLQQSGAHTDAIAAFESAMHIDRVNGGLFTLAQLPLVEKIILSHDALGNFGEVDDFHEYLFYIQQKSYPPGDPRLLAAQEEFADWNVEAYLKEDVAQRSSVSFNTGASLGSRPEYVAIQTRDGSYVYVPRDRMLNVLNPTGAATNAMATDFMMRSSTYAIPAEQIIDRRLRTAQDLYEDIIEARTADATAAGTLTAGAAEDIRVQHKLANIAYAVKRQLAAMESVVEEGSLHYNRVLQPRSEPQVVTRGFRENRDALETLAQEMDLDPAAPAQAKAQAWIDLGDWHVGFDAAQRSQEAYRKAWEILTAAGLDASAIAAVFMPQLLVPVPGFALHDYSRALYGIAQDAPLAWEGYMDLTLRVNRFGDVRGASIDAASADTPQVLRSTLLDFLRGQKMRPAVVNGETVEREDLKVRYYYSY